MDWKKFLEDLIKAKDKFLADANTALKPLPPVEQHEASSVVGFAIRELNSAYQWITNTCMQLDVQVKDYIERGQQILADYNKAYMEELITKGDVIPKARIEAGDYLSRDDAQSRIDAAAEKAGKDAMDTLRAEIKLLASRRAELSTPKTTMEGVATGGEPKVLEPALLSREAVEKLPDEFIKADDYKEKATSLAARLKDINALGVPAAEKLLLRAYECPLDETGETQFREQLSVIQDAVSHIRGAKKEDKAPAPFAHGRSAETQSADLAGVF